MTPAPAAPLPPFRLRRPVVLVGLMGAGKTTVGRRLAARLGVPFADSDDAVEEAARMTIPEIFARLGEPAFRDGERRVIARLLDGPPQVIATGGGAFMAGESRALIKERAVSVWLRADLAVLVERTAKRGGRPLLAGRAPADVLAELIAARHPVYAEADLTIDSGAEDRHEAVAERILAALAAHGDVLGGCDAAPPPAHRAAAPPKAPE